MEFKTSRLPNLALTYANDILMDGSGAQLQRIYSIYALSRFLDVSYFHSPLKEIGYQGLSALERNLEIPGITARYNEIFTIISDCKLPEVRKTYLMEHADYNFLSSLKNETKSSRGFHLVRIVFPHHITDQHPQMLYHAKTITPFTQTCSSLFRLAVHVRRGELFVLEQDRMLPNSYYITVALKTIDLLNRLGIPFVCELYTEISSKAFVVSPGHHGINNRIKEPVTIKPEDNYIEEFEVLPNLQKFINGDAIETMRALATADLLITSRSSFSYIAAILNKKGCIVCHPFWHAPLPEWLDYNNQEHFSEKLLEYCKRWKDDHNPLAPHAI